MMKKTGRQKMIAIVAHMAIKSWRWALSRPLASAPSVVEMSLCRQRCLLMANDAKSAAQ
jgi:hypothetical protein